MPDFPRSLIEFQRRFPDERASALYLAQARWPDGFRCMTDGWRGYPVPLAASPTSRTLSADGLPLQPPPYLQHADLTGSNGIRLHITSVAN